MPILNYSRALFSLGYIYVNLDQVMWGESIGLLRLQFLEIKKKLN